MEAILFYIFAGIAVGSALFMIVQRNPLQSALWLVLCLGISAAIFALLTAPFIAIVQVLVYTGAIMVLFIFVIMLIKLGPDMLKERVLNFSKVIGSVLAFYLLVIGFLNSKEVPVQLAPQVGSAFSDPATLGKLLMSKYVVPFEVVSILLFAAVIGSVVLGKKQL